MLRALRAFIYKVNIVSLVFRGSQHAAAIVRHSEKESVKILRSNEVRTK